MIDDQVYNRFARALAESIRSRAKGIDDDSARIVSTRPQEHVLSGFLTPHDVPAPPPRADDTEADAEIDDLPKDSAFELTSLGLEFMADRASLAAHTALSVTLELNVYVRVVPTWSEQEQFGTWQRDRAPGQAPTTKSQALVAAWRRFQIAPFDVTVTVADVLRIKRQRIDVSPQIRLSATESADQSLYSARHAIHATEAELATEVAFSAATARAHPHAFTSAWSASVDVRLINVPTEPNQVRLAVRVINETVAPGRAQVDFVDPNLYGVRISVAVPGTVHRPTVFQELPASFRYDRMMPGVGINAHVESNEKDSVVHLIAESVPVTETPRLEAREFGDADPTFADLMIDPLPVLDALARHMDTYDREQWAAKIPTLSGLERAEADQSRQEFRGEIARYRRGVTLLRNGTYPDVLRAFGLMNESMRTANKAHQRWRLFQIAFIVSLLPELASREYPARAEAGRRWPG